MEATAVSVGKAVLDGALDYAKSKAAEEVALQLDIEGDVAFITDELEMMQSFLMAADEERDQDKLLTTWVKQVRDLAYNVEDSLMDFGLHAELEKASSLCCVPRHPCDRRRIAKEVKQLRAKVEEVSSRNHRYQLIKGAGSKAVSATGDEQPDHDVVKEKSKMNLNQLITSDEMDLRVVAVWATSGDLWKTSEIRKVYDDHKVKERFMCRAWVRLMHPFSSREFLGCIVRQFNQSSDEGNWNCSQETTLGANVLSMMEKMDQSKLLDQFNASVCKNNFLIVINDLSTIEEWDCIKSYFPDRKNRSRIVVSTQQAEIASLCTDQPYQVSELRQFSFDQAIYLFHKKVEIASYFAMSGPSSSTPRATRDNSGMSNEIQEEWRLIEAMDGDNTITTSTDERHFKRSKTNIIEDLIGRRTEKDKVISLVGHPDNRQDRKVISIWGMGGIGKTTLVRSVYRNQQLGGWKRAWATALRPFNLEVLLRNLALQLAKDIQQVTARTSEISQKENIGTMAFEKMIVELSRLLNSQECLIVLDDLSSTKEWDSIKNYLEYAKRIIVTTRENSVAKHCSEQDTNIYSLKKLDEPVALDLFTKKVFKNTPNFNLSPSMLEQAKFILKKCDGLPLAISTISGFLANKPKTTMEWKKLNGRMTAELQINPKLNKINTVLVRSYDGLPYHLKSSFLYMSIFPEDYNINCKRIVKRWIAEGYSREIHGMNAAEDGKNHFEELLDRSMTLLGDDDAKSCQLHDLIREICISKAREERLVFKLEEGCSMSGAQGTIRHLAVSSNWKRDKDVWENMLDLSHLRSLTVFGQWSSFLISKKMRFLRVLDLEDTLGLRDHHLHQITLLPHLKYLSLRGCQNIFSLPDCLGSLRYLQTLDVRRTRILALPTTISMLHDLQYLQAGGGWSRKNETRLEIDLDNDLPCCSALFNRFADADCLDEREDSDDGYGCHRRPYIRSFLLNHIRRRVRRASKLLAISHLFCRPHQTLEGPNRHEIFKLYRYYLAEGRNGIEVPRGVSKLRALHTLGVVDVSRSNASAGLKELNMLTQLQKLGVEGISTENDQKFWSAIADHNQLRSLYLRADLIEECSIVEFDVKYDCLDGCLDGTSLFPPICLESLKLIGKLVKVTEWIHQLQNLSKLQLVSTRLDKQESIQALGKLLPNLAVLRLRWFSYGGKQLHFLGSSFPSLMVLELQGLFYLESLGFEEGAMPRLELLRADHCWDVEEIAGLPGFLKSLKEIRLGHVMSESLKEKVQRQVEEDQNRVILKLVDCVHHEFN